MSCLGWHGRATVALQGSYTTVMIFKSKEKEARQAAAVVQQMLQLACDSRARFFLEVPSRQGRGYSVACHPVTCDGPTLLLDVVQGKGLSTAWKGRRVDCFFRIVRFKPQRTEQFYSFVATLLDIRKTSTGVLIELEKPQSIGTEQRRRSLRVRPVPELVQAVEFWVDTLEDQPLTAALLAELAPSPLTAMMREGTALLLDVSGGGARVGLSAKAIQDAGMSPPAAADKFVCRLRLAEPGTGLVQTFWLRVGVAAVRKSVGQEGMLDCGLEFLCEGKPAGAEAIDWVPVREGNVFRISRWANAVYMEYVRKARNE